MSESYLKACGAVVYFIETPQMRIPDSFDAHPSNFHWQEMEADMPEGVLMEDG